MRLVQLGCGITGLVCAEHLAKNDSVEELVLADMRTDAAERFLSRVDGDKLSVKKVDVRELDQVKMLLRGADLLVSAVPAELNLPVLKTAAGLGLDYVDYSTSLETGEQFAEVDSLCRQKGVTALTAMGSDPGISDVMAVLASARLDRPETVRVMDGDSGTAEGYDWFTLWSPLEMVEEMTVPAAVYKDGVITYVPPLHERQVYEFPEPIGPLPVYNTIHEETFLIPRHVKGLKYADFRIAIDDATAETARMLRKTGMHGMKPIDVKGHLVRPIDVVVALMPRPVDLAGKVKGYAGIVVEMTGTDRGERKLVKVWTVMSHERAHELSGSNATGYLVGTAGAIGAEMILDGTFDRKGLYVPEQLPPEEVVRRLGAKHIEVKEEVVPL